MWCVVCATVDSPPVSDRCELHWTTLWTSPIPCTDRTLYQSLPDVLPAVANIHVPVRDIVACAAGHRRHIAVRHKCGVRLPAVLGHFARAVCRRAGKCWLACAPPHIIHIHGIDPMRFACEQTNDGGPLRRVFFYGFTLLCVCYGIFLCLATNP